MKLSEAIRLGAMLYPQAAGHYIRRSNSGEIVGTCAMGAAAMAVSDVVSDRELGVLTLCAQKWPQYDRSTDQTLCPVCNDFEYGLIAAVVCLNDKHLWTREDIADWVATVEAAGTVPDLTPEPTCCDLTAK